VIEVDEDDEGRSASDDPLDVVFMDNDDPFLPSSHKLTLKKSRRFAFPTQKEPTKEHAWEEEYRLVQDGGATKSLGRKVPKDLELGVESSIEDFSSPDSEAMEPLPPTLKKPSLELVEQLVPPRKQGGVVQQHVAKYNSNDSGQPPFQRIDLRTKQPISMKAQMKMKVCHKDYPDADLLNILCFR